MTFGIIAISVGQILLPLLYFEDIQSGDAYCLTLCELFV